MPLSGLLTGQNQASPPVRTPDLFPFRGLVERFLPMQRVQELYHRAQQPVNRSLLENVLTEMQIICHVAASDLARIPTTGPVVVTCNHPFGLLDGAIAGAWVGRVREDVKVVTNVLLAGIQELREHCIFIDPFQHRNSVSLNRRALMQAVAWLRQGGTLVIFPAGEVSHLRLPQMQIADPEWNTTAARLACLTGASTVPFFIRGRNSARFQAMGLLHPSLRTAWLLSEFLQQANRKVEMRIGSPIPADVLHQAGGSREATQYLRWRTYLLSQRGHKRKLSGQTLRDFLPQKRHASVADAVPATLVRHDLEQLPPERCLEENRDFAIYLADSPEIPNLLQEVGRLREITFRGAGEGTGKHSDLDRFDNYYSHLLLWSKTERQLVGAYRLGLSANILPRFGPAGLYTSTLFRYDPRVFDQLGPALELGRSFIRPEYQKQYAPLFMLWKGIGRYLANHPEIAVLFGAVSVSNRYNRVSRELIVRFFHTREENHQLARWITPRQPFRPSWMRWREQQAACSQIRDVEDLSGPISDLETDGKGLPILLRQYAKLGGRIVSFNVDRNFSDALDGLVLVDLRHTDPNVLARYMGKDGIKAFQQYHGIGSAAASAAQ